MPSGGGQNPYDFILKGQGKPKRSFGSGSLKQRVIIVAGGALILLIAAVVLISLIGSGGKGNTSALLNVAQQQTELARVAGIGVDKADSTDTKNLAITAQLSMQSSQADTVALLKKSGHKVNDKSLALLQNSNTDQQLDDADASSTFDSTFTQLFKTELNNYRSALQNAYSGATGTQQQLLQADFNDASILIGSSKT